VLTRAKLRPGERGTKRFVTQFGNQLVSVRYLYDPESRKRYTTVELIVAEAAWDPIRWCLKPDTIVPIHVRWGERELAIKVRRAGGTWDDEAKVWRLQYRHVLAFRLDDRLHFSPREAKELIASKIRRSLPVSTNR